MQVGFILNMKHVPGGVTIEMSLLAQLMSEYILNDFLLLLRWIGLGEGMRSEHRVWRHTCIVLDSKVVKDVFKFTYPIRREELCSLRMGKNTLIKLT